MIVGTIGLGSGLLAVAAFKAAAVPLDTIAFLAIAVVLTELIVVPSDDRSFDPLDAHAFSFSTGVHIAAILIVGPWAAALVAAFGVIVVDRVRGAPLRKIAFNASAFALAAIAGGTVFSLLGGTPGAVELPGDFGAIAGLAATVCVLNTALVSSVIASMSSAAVWPFVRDSLRLEASSAVAEAGLGVAIAVTALAEPWALVALAPLVVAVYQAHSRLAQLRRETARALETFANVVDERDPYTYRHSARVAEYVGSLAEGLGLPSTQVAHLRWAGRLHDLGKIAVDAAVLRKPGRLDGDEWAAMQRHPRLSARLLRRFRFAAHEAQAVEYHHERLDGRGYYEIDGEGIPLAAHFLIVADSFDAMTSDRPYRRGLPREQALKEIETNAGSQFHPGVAKAFVALQRGRQPAEALSPAELSEFKKLAHADWSRGWRRAHLRNRPQLLAFAGVLGGLAAAGFGALELAAGALVLVAFAFAWQRLELSGARRLTLALETLLAESAGRGGALQASAELLAADSPLRWAGLLSWRESELAGALALEWRNGADGPSGTALTSWILRESEAEEALLVAGSGELGRDGVHVALPLRREGSLAGYLVLGFAGTPPRRVELALRNCAVSLGQALAEPSGEPLLAEPRRLAAV